MSDPLRDPDARWLGAVAPPLWKNPSPAPRYNLVVLGGGTAGLVAAAGAAGLGARVALVERHRLGGDCLNTGCVPSKALLRGAALAAHRVGSADSFADVMARLKTARADIAPHDSAERFSQLGVDVFFGEAQFSSARDVTVAGSSLSFARALIATGGRPAVPKVPGLEQSRFHTSETIFTLEKQPQHLLVLGGGPIGCELAQAFARLGTAVTLVTRGARLLTRDDPEAGEAVTRALLKDGVRIHFNTTLSQVGDNGAGIVARLEPLAVSAQGSLSSSNTEITADAVLVAAGRRPNVASLNLGAAGIRMQNRRGSEQLLVNDCLRTTNPRVFAAGDVVDGPQFTHAADAMARIALQNALFFGRKKLSKLTVPWATYTDPEVAHVGASAQELDSRNTSFKTYTVRFTDLDRGRIDSVFEQAKIHADQGVNPHVAGGAIGDGFLRAYVGCNGGKGKGRILGLTICGPHAGDLIATAATAMAGGVELGKLGHLILPYPTYAEAFKRLADLHARDRLTPSVLAVFRRYFRWRRT